MIKHQMYSSRSAILRRSAAVESFESRYLLAADLFVVRQYGVGADPAGAVAVDLNGDGKRDVVEYSSASETASFAVLLNAGNGSLNDPVFYAQTGLVSGMQVVDVSGDGKPDLIATTGSSSGQVVVRLNNGSGTFLSPKTYVTGEFSSSPIVADFTGDGKADIVVAKGSASLSLLVNSGSGNFASALSFNVGAGMRGFVAADVTGDKRPDLIASTTAGIVVLKNVATTARFASALTTALANTSQYLVAADFTGDGKRDIAVAIQNSPSIDVLPGTNTGTFGAARILSIGSGNYVTTGLASADLNADARPDLVVSRYSSFAIPPVSSGSSSVFLNSSAGVFGARTDYVDSENALLADVNGDGKPDLVNGNVRLNLGNGAFGSLVKNALPSGFSIAVADFTGDNKADLLMIQSSSKSLSIVGNIGGKISAPTFLTRTSAPSAILSLDINADGRADLITPLSGTNTLVIQRALTNRTFAAATSFTFPAPVTTVASFKLDTDALPDLVVITGNSIFATQKFVYTLRNLGGGNFASPVSVPLPQGSYSLLSTNDVSGDGRPDLVLAGVLITNAPSVSVLLNKNSALSAPVQYAVGRFPNTGVVADLNGDGRPDIATVNSSDFNVSVLINKGSGTFAPSVQYAVPHTGAGAIAAVDLTGDKKPELIVSTNNGLDVYRNNGNGTFGTAALRTLNGIAQKMVVTDLDGDGRNDVVVGTSSEISFLRNSGNGTLATSVRLLSGNVTDLKFADIDGDLKNDLVYTALVKPGGGGGSGTYGLFVAKRGATATVYGIPQQFVSIADPIVLGDFDGDGKLDLVQIQTAEAGVRVLYNQRA